MNSFEGSKKRSQRKTFSKRKVSRRSCRTRLSLWSSARARHFVVHRDKRTSALTCFRVGAQARTTGHTGILIYLSMAERRAEIIADEAIASKVAPEVWGDAMHALLTEIRKGHVGDGMVAAIRKVGAVLAEHLPRAADDQNELPDRVIEV